MLPRLACLAMALVLAVTPASADPPKLPPPISVEAGNPVQFDIPVPAGTKIGFAKAWHAGPTDGIMFGEFVSGPNKRTFFFLPGANAKSRDYPLVFWTVGEDSGATFVITVKGPPLPPPPVPPVPPGPVPPVPPVPPGPTPSPAPIEGDGLRVLFVWDDEKALPASMHATMYGALVRKYLWAKCPKGPDGTTPEFRVYPANTDGTTAEPRWAKAFARPRASLPWIVISDGKSGYEGPLPATPEETLKLIQKWGGA